MSHKKFYKSDKVQKIASNFKFKIKQLFRQYFLINTFLRFLSFAISCYNKFSIKLYNYKIIIIVSKICVYKNTFLLLHFMEITLSK